MAGTILKNIVDFTGLVVGVPVSLPHGLALNTIPTVPQFVAENASGFNVAVDAENVTVTRTAAAPSDSVGVYVECWHTIEEVLPPDQLVGRVPFYVSAGGGGGGPDVDIFVPGAGAGSAIQNNTSGNATTGFNSTVCGENNQLTGEASFASGNSNVETGADCLNNYLEGNGNRLTHTEFAHIEGFQNSITSDAAGGCDFSHVEGNRNTVTGNLGSNNVCDFLHVEGNENVVSASGTGTLEFSHIEGNQNIVRATANDTSFTHVEGNRNIVTNADIAHVEGNRNTVSAGGGSANHAEGNNNTLGTGARIDNAHVEGNSCLATGTTTHVQGDSAAGIRETQFARASGQFAAAGDAQTSYLNMRGATPGLAPGEAVELKYGNGTNQLLTLEDGKAYAIEIQAIGYSHAQDVGNFESLLFIANQEGGVITMTPAGPTILAPIANSAGAAPWRLTVNVAAAPERIGLTFTTGGETTAAVRIVADVKLIEVARS